MRALHAWILFIVLLATSFVVGAAEPADGHASGGISGSSANLPKFHPATWSQQELERYWRLQSNSRAAHLEVLQAQRSATGRNGMIGGATEPFATHIGSKVLEQGGTAADAVIATSFAQIVLTAGTAVSYAGIVNAVYYEAASKSTHALNAGFNTVTAETDPMSIPRRGASGRTALVPGYMAGIETLHKRFGKIPLADLLAPAIWIAEQGMPMSQTVLRQIVTHHELLSRLPETKRIFFKADGGLYRLNENFRQPALAKTLRMLAAEGARHMHSGGWAQHFVNAVQREGGKMTLDDLAAYRAEWAVPAQVSFNEYQVVSLGIEHRGARVALASLKAAEVADLKTHGHYASSSETLRILLQISRIETQLASPSPEARAAALPGPAVALRSQISEETAKRVVDHIRSRRDGELPEKAGSHTAPIVAVDQLGNAISLVPSSNTGAWGSTGIFVDGVFVPDSAKFQQAQIAATGPGNRLTDPTNPIIVLKQGRPVLVSGAMGGNGLPSLVLQRLVGILEFGDDVRTAADRPYTLGPFMVPDNGRPNPAALRKEVVLAGSFSESVLDNLRSSGQPIEVRPTSDQEAQWIAIQIDADSGALSGAASRELPALFEAH